MRREEILNGKVIEENDTEERNKNLKAIKENIVEEGKDVEERDIYMWLGHIKTFRNGDVNRLFQIFGTAENLFQNIYQDDIILCKLVEEGFIKNETRLEILSDDFIKWKDDLTIRMANSNVKCTTILDSDYPDRLHSLADRPLCLYYRGDITIAFGKHIIGMIGSRSPSQYGINVAMEFAREISRKGIIVVSGMAYGIDGISHRAVIQGCENGKTIAVLGGGVDICYPRTNFDIYTEMCENHLVLSEYEPGEQHISMHFPRRNRIISGISDGLLVVEATPKSGTMITVDYALEQGKYIYAIPGRIMDGLSKGTNSLIKQGAMLVDSPMDIICDRFGYDIIDKKEKRNGKKNKSITENFIHYDKEHIDTSRDKATNESKTTKESESRKERKAAKEKLSQEELKILKIIGYDPVYVDDIIRINNMKIAETIHILNSLEKKGLIRNIEQGYYVLSGL